jgi:membrane protease YdiL (CAAX protease family)
MRIVAVTAVVEGLLALLFVVWHAVRPSEFSWIPRGVEVLRGGALALPLLTVNLLLFHPAFLKRLSELARFRAEVIAPLVRLLPPSSFWVISLLAGVGEELFFRGVLLTEFGIVLSSAAFALLHFGTAAKRFPFVVVLYFAVGLYFAAVAQHFSLWSAVFCHAIYDVVVLYVVRSQLTRAD